MPAKPNSDMYWTQLQVTGILWKLLSEQEWSQQLYFYVCWSKTIQYHDRTLLVPVPKVEHSNFFPLSAVVHAFKLAGVLRPTEHDLGPAFTYQKNGTLMPLTYLVLTNKLKLHLTNAVLTILNTLDTPFVREEQRLPKVAASLGLTLNSKVTGAQTRMNVIWIVLFNIN